MNGKCKDCQGWNTKKDIYGSIMKKSDEHGFCQCAMQDNPGVWPPNANGFYTDDVEKAGCSSLWTGPEFGCVHFLEKESKT